MARPISDVTKTRLKQFDQILIEGKSREEARVLAKLSTKTVSKYRPARGSYKKSAPTPRVHSFEMDLSTPSRDLSGRLMLAVGTPAQIAEMVRALA